MSVRVIVRICISLVWLVNGLYCKLLGFVPRHEQIVARILGELYAAPFTKVIGGLEVLMAVWILSRIKPSTCAVTQAVIVTTMNIIEAILTPELLLFRYINLLFATLFIAVVLFNEFYRRPAIMDKN